MFRTTRRTALAALTTAAAAAALVPAGAYDTLDIILHEQLHHGLRHHPQEVTVPSFRQEIGQR